MHQISWQIECRSSRFQHLNTALDMHPLHQTHKIQEHAVWFIKRFIFMVWMTNRSFEFLFLFDFQILFTDFSYWFLYEMHQKVMEHIFPERITSVQMWTLLLEDCILSRFRFPCKASWLLTISWLIGIPVLSGWKPILDKLFCMAWCMLCVVSDNL